MNETQAKMVILLEQIPPVDRNMYYLAAKLNISVSAIYNYLKVLEAGKHILKIKRKNKAFYEVIDGAIVKAREVMVDVSWPLTANKNAQEVSQSNLSS